MKKKPTYLNPYILQQNVRIRVHKNILGNIDIIKGKTKFYIYFNNGSNSLALILGISHEGGG